MKNQKGITLIALVITIIVMLILVGVSVTVALNGGLFTTAQDATDRTKAERDNELVLSDGKVEINGEWYNSIDEYVNGSSAGAKVEILPKKETYTVGEEVTIGEEHFFVIADTTEKVTLLAKYNLNTAGTAQDTEGNINPCTFSTTPYWTEEDADLSDNANPDGAMAIAKAYGVTVSGTEGRLLKKDEADALNTEAYSGILYGTHSNIGYLSYWLGSASSGTGIVWHVDNGMIFDDSFENGLSFGIRPVIEISKSAIK